MRILSGNTETRDLDGTAAQAVQDVTQAALHVLPWATAEPGGQLVVDDGDALALEVGEAVSHGLQLIG